MNVLVHPSVEPLVEAVVAHPGGTLLLHGPKGIGKRTLALDIARRLNCDGCDDGSCRSCRMAAAGNHPNILLVSPDEKGKIGIEAVHQLHHSLQYEQYEASGRQVVVITGADTLTLPAQNALLKTLEEPPAGTTVLLTALSPNGLIETVRSRCRTLFLPVMSGVEVASAITRLTPSQAASAQAIAALSQGRPGLALNYARHPEALELAQAVSSEVGALLKAPNLFDRLKLAGQLAAVSDRREQYLDRLTQTVRANARSTEAAQADLSALVRLRERLGANVNARAAFEALALELA